MQIMVVLKGYQFPHTHQQVLKSDDYYRVCVFRAGSSVKLRKDTPDTLLCDNCSVEGAKHM